MYLIDNVKYHLTDLTFFPFTVLKYSLSQCIDFLLYIVPNKVIRAIQISYHTFKKASENKLLILFNTERLQKSEEKNCVRQRNILKNL